MQAELHLGHGVQVSRKRVQRLMRQAGVAGLVKVKRGKTTIRVPGVRVADDLVDRQFRPCAPNVLWVADLTYLRTWEGALSRGGPRRVLQEDRGMGDGWHMRSELVLDALQMGLARRCPEPGLIHHSDQGSQYVSLTFGQKARDTGVAVSMGQLQSSERSHTASGASVQAEPPRGDTATVPRGLGAGLGAERLGSCAVPDRCGACRESGTGCGGGEDSGSEESPSVNWLKGAVYSTPEDAGRVAVYLIKEHSNIGCRIEQVVAVPASVAVSPVERP